MDSYDYLVIILSITLFIFLVVSIVCGILVIKFLKKVNKTTEIVEQTVEDVQEFTAKLKTIGDVSVVGSALAQVAKIFKKGE
jgi:uncharacterized membrane-anchored protein YhcB (DUF1043 family)